MSPRRLRIEMDRHLRELREEVGEPSKLTKKRAAAWAERVLVRQPHGGTGRSRRAT